MNKDRIEKILKKNYPNIYRDFSILTLEKDKAKVELIVSYNFMRTATKISNNAIFSLVNITFHVATVFTLGPKSNSMVTNINFNFMRPAPPKNMFAEARILKITKNSVIGDVLVLSSNNKTIAHSAITLTIPNEFE